jgi:hypothetical protein
VRRRWLWLALAAILLLAVGVAVGNRTAPDAETTSTVTVTVGALSDETGATDEAPTTPEPEPSSVSRTPEGAVTAATAYLRALDGPVILDPAAVRRVLTAIVSSESRADLIRAYEQAAGHAREQLGVDTGSDVDIVLRTALVGYRVDGFHPGAATISIWRVGIVGSDARVEPRQSWRTETVSLVWEDGTWKVDAVRSSPGPTPPLAGPAATPPADLFAAIPRFEEFKRGLP